MCVFLRTKKKLKNCSVHCDELKTENDQKVKQQTLSVTCCESAPFWQNLDLVFYHTLRQKCDQKKNLSFWWLTLLHQSPERKFAFLVDSKKNLLLTAASSVQEVNPTAGSWTLKLQHHVKQTEAEAELNLWITS